MADPAASSADLGGTCPPTMGRYTPLARLGDGGMADVYLAVARGPAGFNKLVVVKRLRNAANEGLVEMFMDEARLSARLNHPNIVETYEVGDVERKPFIAMAFLEGQSLEVLLGHLARRDEGLTAAEAAYVGAQVAQGLHYAHELADYDGSPLHVVHRDVSPQNVFLTYRGEVRLIDFGIAKTTVNLTRTETGILKGKIRYMAPEQVSDEDVDRRVDVFALGIVLWEMLARRRLFDGDALAIIGRLGREEAPLLRSVRPDVPAELEAIVAKALRRVRDERYANAAEIAAALETFLRTQDPGVGAALAKRLEGSFGQTREAVRARIHNFLAALPPAEGASGDASAPGVTLTRDSLLPELNTMGSDPRLVPIERLSGASMASAHVLSSPNLRPPQGARAKAFVGGAIALVAIVAATAYATRSPSPPMAVAAAAPATARIHIETAPAGATVEIDGHVVGTTPLDLTRGPGRATLAVSRDGYVSRTMALDVVAGGSIDRQIALTPAPPASAVAPLAAPAAAPASLSPPHRTQPASHAPSLPAPSASTERSRIRVIDDGP